MKEFFRNFARGENKKKDNMTQKGALELALKELGGRANLKDIYPIALKYITHKDGSKIYDSLRGAIHDKRRFRPSPGMPTGWYELLSYQEEVAILKKENTELKEENKQLIAIPKEADFVDRFLKEVMNEYKRKRGDADPIRNILRHMNHEEAAAVLDAWIDKKEDELKTALEKLAQMALKPINILGDYVIDKHVGNEVNGVASGATGINVNKEKK